MDVNDIIERRACISGVGQSEIGRRLFRDPLELTLDGCLAAIAHACARPTATRFSALARGCDSRVRGRRSRLREAARVRPTARTEGARVDVKWRRCGRSSRPPRKVSSQHAARPALEILG